MAEKRLQCAGWHALAREVLSSALKPINDAQFWPSLLKELKELVVRTINAILAEYDALSKAAIDLDNKLQTLLENFKRAMEAVQKYEDHIRDVRWYGSDEKRIEKIREGIKRRNFTLLTEFITQLETVYLVRAEESCREAEEALEGVRSSAQELSAACKKRAVEANTRKKAVTGTAAVGGIGVGLAVAGMATFGIGTVVGLGVSYVIYRESSNNAELKAKFESLSQSFDDAKSRASRQCDQTRKIVRSLTTLSTAIDTIEEAMDSHEGPSYADAAFKRLCENIKELEAASIPSEK